ncbi:MAG: amidoligase family protein [Clostridia bacterium]|nr:amidoligase family protein [Clostridia bacterium]
MEETKITCAVCGTELDYDTDYYFDGRHYCEECLEGFTVVCEYCEERILEEGAITDSNHTLCQECFDEYYTYCEDCGAIISNVDAYYLDEYDEYPYCHRCYQRNIKYKGIHDYSYKPDPIFKGAGERYFGVELEVDCGGHYDENAEIILNIANTEHEDRIYIKSDGSIDSGFEIVSHPMTLDYHINEMPWLEIMNKLISMGYRSHKTDTCGLHCHINRTAFGDTRDKQEEVIARIIYFVEHHWEEILRFSRRTEYQMSRWAARYGMKNNPKALYDDVKKCCSNRYRAVNILNYSTIEFRMFRGTLKYNSFIATLQFVNEICNVAVSLSDEKMELLTWQEFLNRLNNTTHRELIQYLKERNLYEMEGED